METGFYLVFTSARSRRKKKNKTKKNKKMKRETAAAQSNSFAIYGQIDERYTKMSLFLIDKQSRLVLQSGKLFLIMSRTIDQYI